MDRDKLGMVMYHVMRAAKDAAAQAAATFRSKDSSYEAGYVLAKAESTLAELQEAIMKAWAED